MLLGGEFAARHRRNLCRCSSTTPTVSTGRIKQRCDRIESLQVGEPVLLAVLQHAARASYTPNTQNDPHNMRRLRRPTGPRRPHEVCTVSHSLLQYDMPEQPRAPRRSQRGDMCRESARWRRGTIPREPEIHGGRRGRGREMCGRHEWRLGGGASTASRRRRVDGVSVAARRRRVDGVAVRR